MRRRTLARSLILLSASVLLFSCGGGETTQEPRFDPAYQVYSDLLQRHVDDAGWVDYAGLKADSALVLKASLNLRALLRDSLDASTPQAQTAYWINAYNLLLLEAIVQYYPVDSIQDILNVLDRPHYSVAERNVSLNDIDRNILMRNFSDPRIGFALCRASISSPILSREPYDATRLQAQLQRAARQFLTDTTRNIFEPAERTAIISPLFEWYQKEFKNVFWSEIPSDQPDEIRAAFNFIADVLPDSRGRFLREEGVTWSYLLYDWRLNDKAKAGLLSER